MESGLVGELDAEKALSENVALLFEILELSRLSGSEGIVGNPSISELLKDCLDPGMGFRHLDQLDTMLLVELLGGRRDCDNPNSSDHGPLICIYMLLKLLVVGVALEIGG